VEPPPGHIGKSGRNSGPRDPGAVEHHFFIVESGMPRA